MSNNPTIEILLATYNGEKYLKEQLDSILLQSYHNWKITIRDDNSTDKTLSIISEYINNYPEKFSLLNDGKGHIGSSLSFASLLENSKNEYIMLCDQDDVWLEFKIEITLKELLKQEKINGKIPLMIFTDLKEVDQDLNILSESFIESQKLYPSIISNTTKLAALNIVAGCTTIINKQSLQVILPLTSKHVTHDQWMAINISKYGKIFYISTPTILYRQHSRNIFGANKINLCYFLSKTKKPLKQLCIYRDLLTMPQFKINIYLFIINKLAFTIKRLL